MISYSVFNLKDMGFAVFVCILYKSSEITPNSISKILNNRCVSFSFIFFMVYDIQMFLPAFLNLFIFLSMSFYGCIYTGYVPSHGVGSFGPTPYEMWKLPITPSAPIASSFPDEVEIEDPRKALVLDLDETLIHTSAFPPHKEVKTLIYHEETNEYVFLRPGVEEFLTKVCQMYEVYIFTASTKEYADEILDKLCPQIDVLHRFYRDNCKFKANKVKKDLTKFHRPLSEVIMIDDNPNMKKLYPNNTIAINKWNGTPLDHQLLDEILPILEKCENAPDIRPIIKNTDEQRKKHPYRY